MRKPSKGSERVRSWIYVLSEWIDTLLFDVRLFSQAAHSPPSKPLSRLYYRYSFLSDELILLEDLTSYCPKVGEWRREYESIVRPYGSIARDLQGEPIIEPDDPYPSGEDASKLVKLCESLVTYRAKLCKEFGISAARRRWCCPTCGKS